MEITEKRDENWSAGVLHQEIYRLLSELRVTMIGYVQGLQGTIDQSEFEYFRACWDMKAIPPAHMDTDLVANADVSWRDRAAFLVSVDTFDTCTVVEEL